LVPATIGSKLVPATIGSKIGTTSWCRNWYQPLLVAKLALLFGAAIGSSDCW